MSRISIDVTDEEHKKLKALAALQGKSIKDFVMERTLGLDKDDAEIAALAQLERMLDERIQNAKKGVISKRTVEDIFEAAFRKTAKR